MATILESPRASSNAPEAPRTMARATTEILQGLRGAERAADHLALAAEILSVLGLRAAADPADQELVRDLDRFSAILRVRSSAIRQALQAPGASAIDGPVPAYR